MRAIVTVDLCWTGCSQCVDSEFTQLFKGLLVQCVCVCARGNACLPLWTNKRRTTSTGKLCLVDHFFDVTLLLVWEACLFPKLNVWLHI